MRTHVDRILAEASGQLAATVANLRALSPQATLDRGYSILLSQGSVLSDAAEAHVGQELDAVLGRGRLALTITAIPQGDNHAQEERP